MQPLHDPETPEWMDYSNCLGVDASLFFPARGEDTRQAKAVCAGCVVREECLEYAMTHGEKHGIWGGMSERERRRLRRIRANSRLAGSPYSPPPANRDPISPPVERGAGDIATRSET